MSGSRKQQIEKVRARTALLERGSEQDVAAGLRRCVGRLATNYWLDPSSAFTTDSAAAVLCWTSERLTPMYDDLADYAAASAVLHCADSWSYLGRAVNALSAGLVAEAVHLTYYSEVRAAISLLACSGIVVTNGDATHVLAGSRTVMPMMGGSTHSIVWQLLHEWSSTPKGIAVIGEIVHVQGRSLTQWLNARRANGNTGSTISSLLEIWGADLLAQKADSLRRNVATYQPGRLELGAPHKAAWIRRTASDVCRSLEPGSSGTFPLLDLDLLVQALRSTGDTHIDAVTGGEIVEEIDVNRLVKDLSDDGYGSNELVQRIASRLGSEESLVARATSNPPVAYPVEPSHLEGMLGRAVILARLATGYVRKVQRSGGVDLAGLAPWADNLGKSLGYWDPSPRPEPLVDLWLDLQSSLEDIDESYPTGPRELELFHRTSSDQIAKISGLTRTAIWSLSA